MSNSIGNNLLHQSSLPSTVLETQSRINSSCIGGNTLLAPQATSIARKSPLSTEFRGCKLTVQKSKLPMGKHRSVSGFPRAVLATDPSEVTMADICLLWYYCSFDQVLKAKSLFISFAHNILSEELSPCVY